MNKKIRFGKTTTTLIDRMYIASGGEASLYKNGDKVFKIYHDSHKTLPQKKIQELSLITNSQVVVPKDLIFDFSTGEPLGYTTDYIDNVEPLLKLFTKTFKNDNNINPKMIAELVKQTQLITNDVHGARCLIVDFNELNVLVNLTPNILIPYFIDVDSYATPNFKATAIMDSVRDRRVTSYANGKMIYNADVMSDWFSWGIITFWMYTNIHPFRGSHPDYKPKDKQKQMDDGISVFHRGVRVPPSVNNFDAVIPAQHRDWYKDVFLNNNRSVPPLPDSIAPLTIPASIITVTGNNSKIEVIQVVAFSEKIVLLKQIMGINYVVTSKKVYSGSDKELFDGCEKFKKTLICSSSDGTPIMANLSGNRVAFTELSNKREIGTISSSNNIIERNGCIYTVSNGKVVENMFTSFGNKIIHRISEIDNISTYTSTIYEGCIIQDLLGKKHITIPYKKGSCFTKYITQLDGYRIVDAKSERNIIVVIAEKNGQYDRFIICFKKDYSEFDVIKVEDIAYDGINFTVLENGLCLLLASTDELEIFSNNQNIQVMNNPPFDYSMRLFNTSDGAFFINGNTIHQIKKK